MVGDNQKSGELMSLRILNQWQTRSWNVNITASLAINQDKLDVFSLSSRGPLRSWARYPQISDTEHTFYCFNSLSWFTSPLSQYFLGWPPPPNILCRLESCLRGSFWGIQAKTPLDKSIIAMFYSINMETNCSFWAEDLLIYWLDLEIAYHVNVYICLCVCVLRVEIVVELNSVVLPSHSKFQKFLHSSESFT